VKIRNEPRDRAAGATDPIGDIDEARRAVADEFEARIEQLTDEAATVWRSEIPEFSAIEQPDAWDATRRLTYESRRLQAGAVRSGRVPRDIPHDAEAARLAAAAGLSSEAVLRSYQIAGGLAWQTFMTAIERVPVDREITAELFGVVADLVRAYEERLISEVDSAYRAERGRSEGASERAKVVEVRRLLEGHGNGFDRLRYGLAAKHLALIAWGSDPAGAIAAAREQVPIADSLEVQLIEGQRLRLRWGWLSLAPAFSAELKESERGPELLDGPLSRIELPEGTRLVCGEPGIGLAGFRTSHRQAGRAYAVAERLERPLTRYREVALEALLIEREEAALELSRHELAGLDGDSVRDRRLRETLTAYFEAGQNAVLAAAALAVTEQTVSRRLRLVSTLIGAPVQSRRAELEVALRAHELRRRAVERGEGLLLG
jgi:hypothetical protein